MAISRSLGARSLTTMPDDFDLAAGNVLEARYHAQQRRFPASRRADQNDEFAVGNVDGNSVQHFNAAIVLANISDRYGTHLSLSQLDDRHADYATIRVMLSFACMRRRPHRSQPALPGRSRGATASSPLSNAATQSAIKSFVGQKIDSSANLSPNSSRYSPPMMGQKPALAADRVMEREAPSPGRTRAHSDRFHVDTRWVREALSHVPTGGDRKHDVRTNSIAVTC